VNVVDKNEDHVKMRILQATKKLSATKGFEATSVREICKEANANISLVSYYYGGKESLFEAMLQEFIPIPVFSEHLRREEVDPIQGMKRLIEQMYRFCKADPEISDIVHQEFTLHSERIDIIRKYTLPVWLLLRDYLQAGQAQGVFHFQSLDHTFLQVMGSILFGSNEAKSLTIVTLLDIQLVEQDDPLEELIVYILRGLGCTVEQIHSK